jgi:hypothetical protein
MLVEIEALFASQVRIMKYELMDKFLSIELEENIYLKSHTQPWWNSWVPHRLGILDNKFNYDRWGAVLTFSSYKDIVIGYAMQGESFTFHRLRTQLRTVKVEPIAGEIVKTEKVYLIYNL